MRNLHLTTAQCFPLCARTPATSTVTPTATMVGQTQPTPSVRSPPRAQRAPSRLPACALFACTCPPRGGCGCSVGRGQTATPTPPQKPPPPGIPTRLGTGELGSDCADCGARVRACGFGSDCTDCGAHVCSNTCHAYEEDGEWVSLAHNGMCEDSGSAARCARGTDCADCGMRNVNHSSIPRPMPPPPPWQPASPLAPRNPCFCLTNWSYLEDGYAACSAQHLCPATPCDNATRPWCMVANPGCDEEARGQEGWAFCVPATGSQEHPPPPPPSPAVPCVCAAVWSSTTTTNCLMQLGCASTPCDGIHNEASLNHREIAEGALPATV